jgi:antitoxin (DNA-binding transcriptional repressor) of toxin-antitoxin stability system
MKNIKDEVSLSGRVETITMMDLRKKPGEVLSSVALGKTFIITRAGKPIAELKKMPEKPTIKELEDILNSQDERRIIIKPDGSLTTVPV